MRTEKATFAGSGGQTLAIELDLPLGHPRAVALLAHCFTCGKDLKSMKRFAAGLTDQGIAVARFDFTGLGASSGDFGDTGFRSNVDDILAAADWLRQTWSAPSLLIGHSLGGAAVLVAAPRIPELAAVVTVGAPADPGHVTHLFEDALDEIEAAGRANVSIAGRTFAIGSAFVADIADAALAPVLAELRLPKLFVHAPDDEVVGFDNAVQLLSWSAQPASLVSLDGADHLLSAGEVADRAAAIVVEWADAYLPDRPVPSDDVLEPALEGEVVVSERGTGRFAQVVRVADRHAVLSDEPIGIGDDTGPAPYDFLLAALGTCTSMTLRMYADRKEIPLEDVSIRLRHGRVHAKDCEECESTSGQVDVIDREITLVGDLTDEQRARMLEIADRCPVHRTLHNELLINSTLAAG